MVGQRSAALRKEGPPQPVLLTLPAHAGLMLGARETPVAADKHAASPAPPDFTPESRGVPSAEGAAEVYWVLVEARGTAPRTRSARPGHGWRQSSKLCRSPRGPASTGPPKARPTRSQPLSSNVSENNLRTRALGQAGAATARGRGRGGARSLDRYRWEMTGGRPRPAVSPRPVLHVAPAPPPRGGG